MTIVIPLLNYTTNNFQELRYCLRGVERFHPECHVFILGTKPDWLKNVTYIHISDHPNIEFKEKNIHCKIMHAFNYLDDMLFMNDDHFLLAPVDYLHHNGSLLVNKAKRSPYSSYGYTIGNTIEVLGNEVDNYDTHCPIYFNKKRYLASVGLLDWRKNFGYCIKTSYIYLDNVTRGTFYPDAKYNEHIPDVSERLYFSTNDNCDLSRLKDIYPVKSKYEI